jgi:hypothetical protein
MMKKKLDTARSDFLFEKFNIKFIRERLPHYEVIWSNFSSREFNSLSEEKRRKKQLIAENLFTCLESVICMKKICETEHVKTFYDDSGKKVSNQLILEKYIDLLNDFLAYHTHIGRIHERIEKVYSILGHGKVKIKYTIKNDIINFYGQRNNVLHSHKLPFLIDKDLIGIPELESQGIRDGWDHKEDFIWQDFLKSEKKLQPLKIYFEETFSKLCLALDSRFSSIMSEIKKWTKNWEISDSHEFPTPEWQQAFDGPSNTSGASFNWPHGYTDSKDDNIDLYSSEDQ